MEFCKSHHFTFSNSVDNKSDITDTITNQLQKQNSTDRSTRTWEPWATWKRSLVPWAWSMWFDLWLSLCVKSSHCWEMDPSSACTSTRSFESSAEFPVWERIPSADCVSWSNCGRLVSNSRSINLEKEEKVQDSTEKKSQYLKVQYWHVFLNSHTESPVLFTVLYHTPEPAVSVCWACWGRCSVAQAHSSLAPSPSARDQADWPRKKSC